MAKAKPIQCHVCEKKMLTADGSKRVCSETSDLRKPRGWKKTKNGDWLCPDFVCRNLYFRQPKEGGDIIKQDDPGSEK